MKVFEETKHTKFYITDTGEVFSSTTYLGDGQPKQRKVTVNKKRGYVYCRTSKRNYLVHRLVAEAFIPNPLGLKYVDHLDCDKTNNRVENLEWVTQKENVRRAVQRGRVAFRRKGDYLKYTQDDYNNVVELIAKGYTYRQAGAQVGMPYSTVAHFMRGSRGVKNEN